MRLSVIILAAGQGKRMVSTKPKVLQKLSDKTLIEHVLDTVNELNADQVSIVHGHLGQQLKDTLKDYDVVWVEQTERLGTGSAVKTALPFIKSEDMVLILYGDVPLISAKTLKNFISEIKDDQLGILTATVDNPHGLGRIIRDDNQNIMRIVEQKDANEAERQVKEINTGICALKGIFLEKWLPKLKNDNAQGEYYLTDIVSMAKEDGVKIIAQHPEYEFEITGVNNRVQLASLERQWQLHQAHLLLEQGVSLIDPARIDIRGNVDISMDTTIDVNVILEGTVNIGSNCYIGANCILKDVEIDSDVTIKANSIIEGASIQSDAEIGPFARVRPGSVLNNNTKVGNFVEIKKTELGEGSKVNHLSYIGDATVGKSVNIGAGVITCNYDGVNKHQTIIEDDVFVGSDSQLVAPVKLGKGSYIGSGSTITKNTPEGKLTVNRSNRQITLDAWQRPKK